MAGRRVLGPCLIDTGFNVSIYVNEDLALLLEGVKPVIKANLYTIGERVVECELFNVKGFLVAETGERVLKLGDLLV